MKRLLTKFLMLLGVFLYLGAGNASAADYWLIGDGAGGMNVPPKDDTYKFKNENGSPVLYIPNLTKGYYKLSLGTSSWDDTFGAKEDQFAVITLNKDLYSWRYKDQQAFRVENDLGPVKITIKGVHDDGKNVQIYCESYTPAVTYPDQLYLVGNSVDGQSNWGNETAVMEKTSDGVYSWTGTSLGNGFKVTDKVDWKGSYNIGNNNGGKITLGQAYNYSNGNSDNDFEFVDNIESVTNPTVTVNLRNGTITVSGTPVYPTLKYMIHGEFRGGTDWKDDYILKNDGGDLWTYTMSNKSSGKITFGIRAYYTDPNKQVSWIYGKTKDVVLGSPLPCVIENNNNGANFELNQGKYRFVFNSKDNTLTITQLPEEKTYILHGKIDDTWRDYPFIKSDDSKYIWTLTLPGISGADKEFGIKELIDGDYNEDWYAVVGTISENNPKLKLAKASKINSTFGLDPNKIYTFTWNSHTGELSVKEATSIFMYGHINGGSWDRGNFAELVYNPTTGYYTVDLVSLQGQWNERDVSLNKSRELWDDSSPNYFAFYTQVQTDIDFDQNNVNHMKFGNPGSSTNNNNLNLSDQAWHGYIYRQERTNDNFYVPVRTDDNPNYYKVEFDAVNKQVKLTAVEVELKDGKIVRQYSWYSGDDSNDNKDNAKRRAVNADGYYTYTFVYGDDSKNVVQVALFSNPKHDAARQAEYTVLKKTVTRSASIGKRYALNDNDYTPAKEGTDYRIEGSSDFDDNTLVHLYSAGEYLITANLAEGAVDNKENPLTDTYSIEPSSILVTVASAEVAGSFVVDNTEDEIQPWSMTTGNTFKVNIENGDINKDMLEVTATPVGAWATNNGTRPDDFDPYLWGQMQGILSANYNVDGYYDENKYDQALSGTGTDTEYDLTINQHFPCSGIYTLSVDLKDEYKTQYDLKVAPIQVTIYPTLLNVYPRIEVTVEGDNISFTNVSDKASSYSVFDSYASGMGTAGTVLTEQGVDIVYGSYDYKANELPYAYKEFTGTRIYKFWELGEAIFYTPGIYLADVNITATSTKSVSNIRRKVSGEAMTTLDLSDLETENHTASSYSYTVSPILTKNGASTPIGSDGLSIEKFKISPSGNEMTAVDTIGAVEDGEAVYFNLQGVRVQNPEHGIFVKVQNGKAVKVVK